MHDLHVWTITSGFPALSAHVLVRPGEDCHRRRRELERLLHDQFGIEHTTLQVDHAAEGGLVEIARPRFARSAGRRAAQLATAQPVERFVRVLEREHLDLGAHGNRRCEREELVAVGTREVRHRADDALAPERVVRGRPGCRSLDPRTHDGAAFADVTQGGGDERAHRSEDDHRVELVGRAGERLLPRRRRASVRTLRLVVICACACVDLASLRDRDLANDVGGRAESVQPDALGVAGEPQRAVPDQPRARSGAACSSV